MHPLPTVTVGIPAHNEEQNIASMISSVLKQNGNFKLKRILVVCDGCNDGTAEIVKKMARSHSVIKLLNDGKRLGKAQRLNQMYSKNTSDFLGTFDADIALERTCELDHLVKEMTKHPETMVVAGNLKPVAADTIVGKMSVISFLSFQDAILRLNGGNNYYSLVGCASLVRGSFARTFSYPKEVVSDMNYLYTLATMKHPLGVRLARDTRFLFRTVNTLHDWRVLAVRSVAEDKNNLVSYFGPEVLNEYHMPLWLSVSSLVKWLFKSPLYTSGSILMNIFIRLFPLTALKPKHGIWEDARSSKAAITT